MKTSDFFFDLPDSFIAQDPPAERGKSRMMVLSRCFPEELSPGHPGGVLADALPGTLPGLEHKFIGDLPGYLADSLVVFNNTKVRKARIFGEAVTGGRVEFLLLERKAPDLWLAMAEKARKQKTGKQFRFPGGVAGEIAGEEETYRILRFDRPVDHGYLERFGHIPLPPYIKREDRPEDARRYQTVYARRAGSVAAPTAGLHFTRELMDAVARKSAGVAWVTLHVGLGTFLPVRTAEVEDHRMHREEYTIAPGDAELINRARAEGKKILAVGTTSLRCLESAWNGREVRSGGGATDIFIYPGYEFKVVNRLLTNFHTPGSTLLMLVSALAGPPPAGRERILAAYEEAKRRGYRFFSYGDCMLIG